MAIKFFFYYTNDASVDWINWILDALARFSHVQLVGLKERKPQTNLTENIDHYRRHNTTIVAPRLAIIICYSP